MFIGFRNSKVSISPTEVGLRVTVIMGSAFCRLACNESSGKGGAVHCALDDPRRDQRILCQARDQRLRSPAAEGRVHGQPFASRGPAAQAGEVRLHCGFIEEDDALGPCAYGGKAIPHPIGPLLPHLGAAALGGDQRPFSYVKPSRDSRLAMDEWCTLTPSASASASHISKSVMSGSCAISSSKNA
jgi:hypothetical protein